MPKQGTQLVLVYEIGQVPLLAQRRAGGGAAVVIALDYEVELELAKHGIPFRSLRDLAVSPDGDRVVLEHTRALALGWYTAPDMAFFEHDGIKLGEQHEVAVLYYLQALVYYVAMLEQVFARFPDLSGVSIFESLVYVSSTVDPTGAFKERLPADVARLLAERAGVACTVIPAPLAYRARGRLSAMRGAFGEVLARLIVGVVNAFVTATTAPRPIKLFASDPWSRLEPFIAGMPDVELVMTRRQELRAMLGKLLRTRARFHHRSDFIDTAARAVARARAAEYARAWDAQMPSVAALCEYQGISYWPVAKQVFDSIVKVHAEDAVLTIENTKRLFSHYGVNCVLLFASTKGYNNVIARVAEHMDIPAIELQHALTNDDKTLVHCRLNSRYLAAYGPLTRRMYESWGVEPWRIVECGSPRFDSYARPLPPEQVSELRRAMRLDGEKLNVLFNIPQIYYTLEYGNYTSYEAREVIEEVASVQRHVPSLRLLLRPKPGGRQTFYHREETLAVFPGETRDAQDAHLQTLLAASDFMITGSSTLVLEGLLMGVPVVMYVPKVLDHDFDTFGAAGAVLLARTPDELLRHARFLAESPEHRAAQVARGRAFLKEQFLLDGGAAARVGALVRRVTAASQSSTMPA